MGKKPVMTEARVVVDHCVRGLTLKQEEQFVRDCWDNFPECALSLQCTGWKYKDFVFKFVDHEEQPAKAYTVDLPKAIAGFRLFVHAVDSGKLPGLGLPANYLDPEEGPGILDAESFDCMLQFATLGEVVYG
jgi:hypothetical protein